jgi:hypothetical protein
MTGEDVLKLAYAAFVADKTAQEPMIFHKWQDISKQEQQRYCGIATIVVREYQHLVEAGDLNDRNVVSNTCVESF